MAAAESKGGADEETEDNVTAAYASCQGLAFACLADCSNQTKTSSPASCKLRPCDWRLDKLPTGDDNGGMGERNGETVRGNVMIWHYSFGGTRNFDDIHKWRARRLTSDFTRDAG